MRNRASALGRELRFILEAAAKGDAGEVLSTSGKMKLLSDCEAQRRSRLSQILAPEAPSSRSGCAAAVSYTAPAGHPASEQHRETPRGRETTPPDLDPAFLRRGGEPAG